MFGDDDIAAAHITTYKSTISVCVNTENTVKVTEIESERERDRESNSMNEAI